MARAARRSKRSGAPATSRSRARSARSCSPTPSAATASPPGRRGSSPRRSPPRQGAPPPDPARTHPSSTRARARENTTHTGGSMSQTSHGAHQGPYTQLTADAARDLRRPIAPAEVRFNVQAVRWPRRRPDKVASAAQVVAYIDARTVIARLNLLFPGAWRAQTDALPLEMRLTRRNTDGTLTPIRITDQGEVKADDTLYYRCRLQIAAATFEDVGAGDDPKPAYSDAIKRTAVRAGIGESLYAMDSPWLRVGDGDGQLRVSRV